MRKTNPKDLKFTSDLVRQFSKALPRGGEASDPGLPEQAPFASLRAALTNAYRRRPQPGGQSDFDAVESVFPKAPVGTRSADRLRWTNPLGGLGHDLEGIDPATGFIPPPPSFAGSVAAAEMIELYWMAALRETPLSSLASATRTGGSGDLKVDTAISSLNATAYYDRALTTDRLFRLDLRDDDHRERWGPRASRSARTFRSS